MCHRDVSVLRDSQHGLLEKGMPTEEEIMAVLQHEYLLLQACEHILDGEQHHRELQIIRFSLNEVSNIMVVTPHLHNSWSLHQQAAHTHPCKPGVLFVHMHGVTK